MQLVYTQPHRLESAVEAELGLTFRPLSALLAEADFISVHCPLSDTTRHLIGARQLAQMKPTAYLINTSRGPVVDEVALVQALQTRRIAGAGLDVFEQEPQLTEGLSALSNVVLLPHLGSATRETRKRMGEVAVANIRAALRGETPPNELTAV